MEKYNNLLIYYFSGTGNARNVAQWMVEEAKQRRLTTHLVNIDRFETVEIPELTGKTLIGFCSPTHGFNLPPIMLEYILKFPKNKYNADILIVNTRAGMKLYKLFLPGLSGIAQYFPALILRIKGYKIKGMQPMDLPSNWISVHPGIRQKVVESIAQRCKIKSKRVINRLLDGKNVYTAFWSFPFDLAISPISIGYYVAGRFMIAKSFMASNACTDCGLCIKQCPVKAITKIDNRLYWKFTCESCMRCMNNCPTRAIETVHGFFTLAIWLGVSVFALLFNILVNSFFVNYKEIEHLRSLLSPFFTIFVFFLLYRLFHYLKRFKIFEYLLIYTSLTKIKYWRRYKRIKN